MKSNRVFYTIDTHTGGNPTRTVIRGIPPLQGATMAEKMLNMKAEHDWIRTFLMYEPRGHDVMSGALLVDPCHPDADIGVIYIETGGYLPMCGHDTIGVCTALVETGLIDVQEPLTHLKLDTPAGLVEVEITVDNGKAKQVTFCNIPSFLYASTEIEMDGSKVAVDIAYGGNFYAIVDAEAVGLELVSAEASRIIDRALRLRQEVNRSLEVFHPEAPYIRGVTHVEFYSRPTHPDADVKNTVVVPPGGIDRSPCGTGTSAKLAVMFAKGEIGIGDPFVHESIVGSLFTGRVLKRTRAGSLDAVVTEISGTAWLMGTHTFYGHEDDKLNHGFLLIPAMEVH